MDSLRDDSTCWALLVLSARPGLLLCSSGAALAPLAAWPAALGGLGMVGRGCSQAAQQGAGCATWWLLERGRGMEGERGSTAWGHWCTAARRRARGAVRGYGSLAGLLERRGRRAGGRAGGQATAAMEDVGCDDAMPEHGTAMEDREAVQPASTHRGRGINRRGNGTSTQRITPGASPPFIVSLASVRAHPSNKGAHTVSGSPAPPDRHWNASVAHGPSALEIVRLPHPTSTPCT